MMKRSKNHSSLLLVFFMSMIFIFTAGFYNKETNVDAADLSRYQTKYMQECCPGIKAIGEVYFTGGKKEPKISQRIVAYSVPYGTVIQGQKITEKYLPHGNMDNLKDIYSTVQGYRNFNWLSGDAEYQETGAGKQYMVAYDDNNIIYWSNGYKSFTGGDPVMCRQSDVMLTHAPGFYRVPKSAVLVKKYEYNERNKYDAKKDKDGNLIVEYRGKGRVTAAYAGIRSLPGYVDTGDSYYVKANTQLLVADTRKIYLEDKNDLYYKIIYRAEDNYVQYLFNFEYFYVPAKYVNLYKNGVTVPSGLTDGKIVDPDNATNSKYVDIPVYKEKSTSAAVSGYVQKGALVQYYEKDCDKTWSKVFFNSEEAYIKTKYLEKVVKPVVAKPKPAPKKVSVKTIKNNEYVMTWSKASGCTDYKIILTKNPFSLTKKNIVYQNNHYKSTTYTVKNSLLKKNTKTGLYLFVAANYPHGTSVNTRSDLIYMGTRPKALKKSQLKISKKEIKIVKYSRDIARIQYATNKSFKKAKTITAKVGVVTKIKKLKSKKTYYIRYADRDYADTDSGGKMVYTEWSPALKVKTK